MEMRSPTLTLSSVHPCSRSRGTLAPSRDHTMGSSLFSDYFHLGPVGNDIVYAEPQSKLPWIAALLGILFGGPGRADQRWRNAVFHLRKSGQGPPKTGQRFAGVRARIAIGTRPELFSCLSRSLGIGVSPVRPHNFYQDAWHV